MLVDYYYYYYLVMQKGEEIKPDVAILQAPILPGNIQYKTFKFS